jgi:hypothetical protein
MARALVHQRTWPHSPARRIGFASRHAGWGFRKAILFLEDGCQEFSNVRGLTHIPFPKGKIEAQFHEATKVLKREKLIS